MRTLGRQTILAAALATIFIVLLVWVEAIGAFPGDRALYRHFSHRYSQWADIGQLSSGFSLLGRPSAAMITVTALAAVAWHRRGREAAAVIVAASGVVAVAGLLKTAIGTTPTWHELVGSTTAHNFPSGHVAYATAVFGAVALLADGPRNRDIRVLAWLMVAGMGPSRIVLHAHLLSDVLAGYAVGGLWLIGVWRYRHLLRRTTG